MDKQICIICCNGLDKPAGVVSREIALEIKALIPSVELICPVLFNTNPKQYVTKLNSADIIVIDGCATRCATKLISSNKYKISDKISVLDTIKEYNYEIGKSLLLKPEELKIAKKIAKDIVTKLQQKQIQSEKIELRKFEKIEYYEYVIDKYHFKVPKEGYYFNENDCWIKNEGEKALIGISDFLQTQLGDILFVELPEIGKKIEQFDDIADCESSKAILELISPVSGEISNVNKTLEENPDLLNSDPYQKGWVVEIMPANFEEDSSLLMNGKDYFEYMKKKALEKRMVK